MNTFFLFSRFTLRISICIALIFSGYACREPKDSIDYQNMASANRSEVVQMLQSHLKSFESVRNSSGLLHEMEKISATEQDDFTTHVNAFQQNVDSTISHYKTTKQHVESLNIYSHHNSEKVIEYFLAILDREKDEILSLDSALLNETVYFSHIKHHKDFKKHIEAFAETTLQDMPKVVNSIERFKADVKNMTVY